MAKFRRDKRESSDSSRSEGTEKAKNDPAVRRSQPGSNISSRNNDSGVPVLTYGRYTNFPEFQRKLDNAALQLCPNIGNIIKDKEYESDSEVDDSEYDPATDVHGFQLRAFQERVSLKVKAAANKEKEKRILFGYIKDHLSLESLQRLSQVSNWEEIEDDRDPLELWKAIVDTHIGANTGMNVVDKEAARKRYNSVSQGQSTLIEYKQRFDMAIEGMNAVKVKKPVEEDMAVHFIDNLDTHRYGELKTMLENNAVLGIGKYPTSLTEAYEVASRFKVKVTKKNGDISYQQAVFVTNYTKSNGKGSSNGKSNGSNSKSGGNSAEASDKKKGNNNNGKKYPPKNTCGLCGEEGHYMLNCPDLDEAKACVCNKKKNNGSTREETVHVTLGGELPSVESGTTKSRSIFTLFIGHVNKNKANDLFQPFDVILDNQATTGLFHNKRLVKNIRKSDYSISVNGVSKEPLIVNLIGDVEFYGQVWYSPHVPVNILPASGVEMKYDIEYHPRLDYTVIIDKHKPIKHVFKKIVTEQETGCGLYVCNMDPRLLYNHESIYVTTVSMNEAKFTKREVNSAKLAREVIRRLGYPSDVDMNEMIHSGAMIESPVTVHDVRRAKDIYGDVIASLKGKSKAKRSVIANVESIPRTISSDLVLHVDIMFVDTVPYLLSISEPLELLMVNKCVLGRSTSQIKEAVMHQIVEYKSKHFAIKTLRCDGEGAIAALRNDLLAMGISVDNAGPGQHVPRIEVKVREVKERCRCHITVLPYALPASFMEWLIYFCVSRINLFPTRNSLSRISPREAFTGRKTNFKRDVRIGFGDYMQCDIPNILKKSDVNQPRTEGCLALLPVGNVQGSVLCYKLSTGRVVTRDHFTILPTPDQVIAYLNQLAAKAKKQLSKEPVFRIGNVVIDDGYHPALDAHGYGNNIDADPPAEAVHNIDEADFDDALPVHPGNDEDDVVVAVADVLPLPLNSNGTVQETVVVVPAEQSLAVVSSGEDTLVIDPSIVVPTPTIDQRGGLVDPTDNVVPQEVDVFDEVVDDIIMEDVVVPTNPVIADQLPPQDVVGESVPTTTRSSQRNRKSVHLDDYYYPPISNRSKQALMHLFTHFAFNITPKKAIKMFGKNAIQAILLELMQMLDKQVWTPVDPRTLSNSKCKKIIRSFMFLKEKFFADGSFEKLKARLVAGGHEQDRLAYDNLASPTVSTTSLFTIAAIAAKEARNVVSLDIGGAYLNANLKADVYMMLDEFSSAILANLDPKYKQYMNGSGRIVVKLLKALYGCVESALLWYEHLSNTLLSMGFIKNRLDDCVFNRGVGEDQCTICVHVDDLFITCKNMATIKGVTKELERVYKEIKVKDGDVHSYLGMNFDFSVKGEVKITMEGYVKDMLKLYAVEGTASTPAQSYLFEVREGVPLLDQEKKVEFHSRVAKMLYLAKRVRPDILQPVIFLSTRVQEPTTDDWCKLERCLKYLNGEPDLGIILRPNPGSLGINAYVDASYGVHADGKSHSGVMIALGAGPIYIRSSKQKIVSKSSTEAELIGLSDACSQIIWCREFLIEQGYEVAAAKVYQDNQSTMALVKKGKGSSDRTKHISIRYFFVKDRVEAGDVNIEYLPTGEMIADVLTKPLQGEPFKQLRKQLLNWYY